MCPWKIEWFHTWTILICLPFAKNSLGPSGRRRPYPGQWWNVAPRFWSWKDGEICGLKSSGSKKRTFWRLYPEMHFRDFRIIISFFICFQGIEWRRVSMSLPADYRCVVHGSVRCSADCFRSMTSGRSTASSTSGSQPPSSAPTHRRRQKVNKFIFFKGYMCSRRECEVQCQRTVLTPKPAFSLCEPITLLCGKPAPFVHSWDQEWKAEIEANCAHRVSLARVVSQVWPLFTVPAPWLNDIYLASHQRKLAVVDSWHWHASFLFSGNGLFFNGVFWCSFFVVLWCIKQRSRSPEDDDHLEDGEVCNGEGQKEDFWVERVFFGLKMPVPEPEWPFLEAKINIPPMYNLCYSASSPKWPSPCSLRQRGCQRGWYVPSDRTHYRSHKLGQSNS